MKYVAIWLGVAAALGLLSILLYGGYLLLEAVQRNSDLVVIPLVILGIIALSTIAAVVEYLTETRKEVEEQ